MDETYYTKVEDFLGRLTLDIPKALSNKLEIKNGTEVIIRIVKDDCIQIEFLTEDIELDLNNKSIAKLATDANKKGITVNQYINDLLYEVLENKRY